MAADVLKVEAGFNIIGIAARTSNDIELQGNGVIPKLWQRFFAEQISIKIPNKADNAIIALYHDYASDKNGAYTLLIGARVTSIDQIPAGMVTRYVPASKNAIFIKQKGAAAHVTLETWQRIWKLEDQGELIRSYTFDYELYDGRSQDPHSAQVAIRISVG
jgi:predicted transcriptional regulator YdeE